MKTLHWLALILGLSLSGQTLLAGIDAETQFDAANKLYAENKFVEAASAYELIATNTPVSAAVYFNLGNARFKAGQIGLALAAYHHTATLSPRDPDLVANQKFARNQVQGPTISPTAWQNWLATLTLNEWTWLCATGVWITFGLLLTRQLKPELAAPLANWTWISSGITTLLIANLSLATAQRPGKNIAAITVADATVRTSPLDQSPTSFVAHDGAELRVLDTKDDWFQVTDGTRRIGWVKSEQAVLFSN